MNANDNDLVAQLRAEIAELKEDARYYTTLLQYDRPVGTSRSKTWEIAAIHEDGRVDRRIVHADDLWKANAEAAAQRRWSGRVVSTRPRIVKNHYNPDEFADMH